MRLAIAIMAAGKGTRLKSKRPKVLHEIGGKPLLAARHRSGRTVVRSAGYLRASSATRPSRSKPPWPHTGVHFVLQAEQRGTGHAIQCAPRAGEPHYDTLLVLSGDVPLIRPETLARCAICTSSSGRHDHPHRRPADPTGYGRVFRSRSRLARSHRHRRAEGAHAGATCHAPEINSGIYCFETAALFRAARPALHRQRARRVLPHRRCRDAGRRRPAAWSPSRPTAPTEVLGANTIAEMMHLDARHPRRHGAHA